MKFTSNLIISFISDIGIITVLLILLLMGFVMLLKSKHFIWAAACFVVLFIVLCLFMVGVHSFFWGVPGSY